MMDTPYARMIMRFGEGKDVLASLQLCKLKSGAVNVRS